jgi:hypothetical protein
MTTPILTTIRKDDINMFYDQFSTEDIGVGIGTTHYTPLYYPEYRASVLTSKASNLYTTELKFGTTNRIGIGTTQPQYACQVIGNTSVGGNVIYDGNLTQRTAGTGTLNITTDATIQSLSIVHPSRLFLPQVFNHTTPVAVGAVYEGLVPAGTILTGSSYLIEIGVDSYRTAIGFITFSVQVRLGATGATTIDLGIPHRFYHSVANQRHYVQWHKIINNTALKGQTLYSYKITANTTAFDAVCCASFAMSGLISSL